MMGIFFTRQSYFLAHLAILLRFMRKCQEILCIIFYEAENYLSH